MITVESIMTKHIFTVSIDDTIRTIRGILKAAKIHHLFVVDGKKLLGVISDRDALRFVSPFLDTLSETTRDQPA